MYLPYLRGKQFELIAIKELSEHIFPAYFRPIIEPVRTNLTPLLRSIRHLNENGFIPVIIINPSVGDFRLNNEELIEGLETGGVQYTPCLVVRGNGNPHIQAFIERFNRSFAIQATGGIDDRTIELARDAEIVIVDYGTPPRALQQLRLCSL